ncbi:protein 5NUC-like [Onthophagus taurus]|uniref:protein 5NUC-like n=1 Tax=Onthophagus taurus TaxID=166361 RepID=UPI0039BE745C
MTLLIKNLLTANIIITFCVKNVKGDLDLLIFHTGCVHARYDEVLDPKAKKYYGGIDRVAYLVKTAREKHKSGKGPAVLYFEPGDFFIGSIWYSVHSYHGVAKVLNELQPDAMNIGASELNAKIEVLKNFSKLVNFPIVSTNMIFQDKDELKKKIKPSIIKIIDGVKVGIVGYILPELTLWGEIGDIEVIEIIPALSKECYRLRFEEDVKVIIALSHAGFETDRIIAYAVDYIDVIVGSGSGTFLWNGVPPDKEIPDDSYPAKVTRRDGSMVLILHAYEYIKYIGKINLQYTKNGKIKGFFGSPILLDSKISQDSKMTELIEELRADVTISDEKILSTSGVLLDGTSCYYEECNFGNMIADAIVEYRATQYQGRGWTDAAVVLVNCRSITANINSRANDKKIYYGDVLRALPFANLLYLVEIKGSDLVFILEISTTGLNRESATEFLYTAGLKVMFDFDVRFGKRVKLIKVRCAECDVPEYFPLEPDKRYKVILNNYLLRGGGGYTIIRDVVWNPIPIGKSDTDATIQYLEKITFVVPEVGGRLIPYDKRFVKKKTISFGSRFNFDCYCFLLMLMNFVTS